MNQHEPERVFPRDKWEWREPLRGALLELDPVRLPKKIEEAKLAILKRMDELADQQDAGSDERVALEDGLRSLRTLSRTPGARTSSAVDNDAS
jgi:hypothetical protein